LAISPFPDSSGYFASGAGWVGAFSSDGTLFWLKDKDGAGQPLPRDLKLRAGGGRLYLWSALARKVWCWGWDDGPSGSSGGLSAADLPGAIRGEIARLTTQGSVPEAASVAQYGVELAQTALKTQPLSASWRTLLAEFTETRRALRERAVGQGVLSVSWDAPFGKPLASWTWEPDASLADVKVWRALSHPFWEGRPYETDDFRLAASADRTPWPGIDDYRQGGLRLPSWMNVELRPDGTDVPVHWTRVMLPAPALPYDLPVE
jgi:hypothetical protein